MTTPDAVQLALFRALPGDLSILTPSPAEDKDTVAVTEATAQKWNLKTIADLAAHSAEVKFGAPSEFLNRTEGLPGLKEKYGLDIAPTTSSRSATAAARRRCGLWWTEPSPRPNIFSTSPAIRRTTWWCSRIRRTTSSAANVVPLVSSQKKSDQLKTVLDAVSAKLTTEDLTELNTEVSGNAGIDPDEAARNGCRTTASTSRSRDERSMISFDNVTKQYPTAPSPSTT